MKCSLSFSNFLEEISDFFTVAFTWAFNILVHISWLLWKCCTQYVSKFGKCSSGHRTGKGQFSLQSQRKAMPKNAQTTTELHSFHMLVKWCSKFFKPGFSNMWTIKVQMLKLVLEKTEEPEVNCQHPLDHQNSKIVPEKRLFLLHWWH